ncbi:MAG: hypothetical protein ACLRL5_00925 [Acutalibacteraceae bacterium]
MFNLMQKWNFPSNNYGQILGIADSGIETFKGTPIKSLAREICQNSLDAALDNNEPTRIEFKAFEIDPRQIPDYTNLEDALKRALDFWSQQQSDKAKTFFKKALEVIHKPAITCLRISDFNTSGLVGSREEYNSPWCNLTKSSGASDKSGSNGGSFGIGKFAPYACSALRTVFYSTIDKDDVCASQGVSRLTSFKNKKNEITQGTGFYGNDKNSPMYKQYSLDPAYSRNAENSGTDIYITAFTGDKGWQHQMVASVLDGFLYAIYNGTLVVDVDGIIISKDTLADLMISHKEYFNEHADEYYQALTDEKLARTFIKELTDDPEVIGKLTLRLIIMPSFSRRVAMIRQTGMKIKDKGNINGLIPFAGTLFIEGDAINSYLRSLENPQHIEWEVERAENKSKANRLLKTLLHFIKASLDEMKNDESEEAIDPTVGEYLSASDFEQSPNQERAEILQDSIKDIKIRVTEVAPKPSDASTGEAGRTLIDDDDGDVFITDLPGEGGSGSQGQEGHGGNGGGNNPGDGGGDIPVEHRKKLSAISAVSVRNMVRNKTTGEYTIVFIPTSSATNGILEVFMSAESQNYEATIVAASCSECPDLKFEKNRINNLTFTEKKAIRINIQFDYHDYCSLEVKAYGNQV